ncbi:MAG: hypothetical protein FWC44_02835 [Methanomassiliicoccaceae archaeon]|nr:hypothetical protein [Methanomassiliicoccaceae archaeon]
MSFFDDNKNIGLLLIIMGIMTILGGVIVAAVVGGGGLGGGIVWLIGALIAGILALIAGLNIRESSEKFTTILSLFGGIVGLKISFDNKVGVVCLVMMVYGITTILLAVFMMIAYAIWGGISYGIGGVIIAFIVGIFFIYSATLISGDRKTSNGFIIWVILLILIILGIIGAILQIIGGLGMFHILYTLATVINGLCSLLIVIFLLIRIISPEIKATLDVK